MAAEKEKAGTRKRKALTLLIGFFILIAALTVLSAVADSFTVAKVSVAMCSSDSLNYNVAGSGSIVSADNAYQYGLVGLRIRKVLVSKGEQIQKGEPIAAVDMADLEHKLEQARQQARKLEIQFAQADLGSNTEPVPQAAADALSQQYRKEDLELAEAALKSAEEKLKTVQERSKDDLLAQRLITLKESRISYYSLLANYDSAVDPAEQAWKDAQDAYNSHPKMLFDTGLKGLSFSSDGTVIENNAYGEFLDAFLEGETDRTAAKAAVESYRQGRKTKAEVYLAITRNNDYSTLTTAAEQLKKQMEKAKSSYEQLKKLWDQRRTVEQMRLESAEDAVEDIENGNYDTSIEYTAAKQAVETAENRVRELQRAIALGDIAAQQNQISEENARRTNEIAIKTKELAKESILLDYENAKADLAQLQALHDREGMLPSQVTGNVEQVFVTPGQRITEEGLLAVNTTGYYFAAELTQQESKNLAVGDTIRIWLPGEKQAVKSKIASIALSAEGTVALTASLPEGSYQGGIHVEFEAIKRSSSYGACIPLSALRQSLYGFYVMTVETQNTILGDRLVATSVPVNVLSQDNTKAAVEFSGVSAEYVILSSNKDIGDGDRVRIVSE